MGQELDARLAKRDEALVALLDSVRHFLASYPELSNKVFAEVASITNNEECLQLADATNTHCLYAKCMYASSLGKPIPCKEDCHFRCG